MDKREEKEAIVQFEEMQNRASEEDIKSIDREISKMKRGPLKDIWDKVLLLWKMIKDPQAAWSSKAIAIAALLYAITPIDAIPDFIALVGLTDDVAVIAAAVVSLGKALKKYSDNSKDKQ